MKKGIILVAVLAAVLVMTAVTYAGANAVVYNGSGSPFAASGSVQATVTINPKLAMTITTPDPGQKVMFAAADPGSGAQSKTVNISVDSNHDFVLAVDKSGVSNAAGNIGISGMNFSTTLAASTNKSKGQNVLASDTYGINPDWTVDPGNYTGTIVYTATQQ